MLLARGLGGLLPPRASLAGRARAYNPPKRPRAQPSPGKASQLRTSMRRPQTLLAKPVRPSWERKPGSSKNARRDDALVPRHAPCVAQYASPTLQSWVASWDPAEPSPLRAGIAELPTSVWGMPLRTDIVHRVVTWERACMRKGNASTKTRAEVRGGGRKPRPQKGTGRSRQGSIRAPQWRGGGRAHGPKPKDWSYKLQQQVVLLGLRTALSDFYSRGALILLDRAAVEVPKTAALLQRLDRLGIDCSRHRVMIVGTDDRHDVGQNNLRRATTNLAAVRYSDARSATLFDLTRSAVLIVSIDAAADLARRWLAGPRH